MARRRASRRNVNNDRAQPTDREERAKNFRTAGAIKTSLEALKGGRHGALSWLFLSEVEPPLRRQTANSIPAAAPVRAGLPSVSPHLRRRRRGDDRANHGDDLRLIEDYLVHRDQEHRAHYTRPAASPIEGVQR
jgi:integrase